MAGKARRAKGRITMPHDESAAGSRRPSSGLPFPLLISSRANRDQSPPPPRLYPGGSLCSLYLRDGTRADTATRRRCKLVRASVRREEKRSAATRRGSRLRRPLPSRVVYPTPDRREPPDVDDGRSRSSRSPRAKRASSRRPTRRRSPAFRRMLDEARSEANVLGMSGGR